MFKKSSKGNLVQGKKKKASPQREKAIPKGKYIFADIVYHIDKSFWNASLQNQG
jgi:hypothetical protein